MMETVLIPMPAKTTAPPQPAGMALYAQVLNNVIMALPTVIQLLVPVEPIAPTSAAGMEFVTPVKLAMMETLLIPMPAETTAPPQPVEMVLFKQVSSNATMVLPTVT